MKKKFLCYSLSITLLLFIWEAIAKNSSSFSFLCPPPSKIFVNFSHSLPIIWSSSWYTLQGILGGFFLAFFLSLILAMIMLTYKPAKDFLHPIFIFVQCTPMFTLAPLIVLWFEWGISAVIIPTALTVFFPLTIAIYQGISSPPKELLELFILNQATKKQIFIKLLLPHALPHIFSGLKIAVGSAGFAAIAGEWVASQSGLGILILESRRNYDMEMMFSGLFALTIVTFTLFQLVVLSEKLLFALFRIKKTKRFKITKLKLAISCLIIFLFLLGKSNTSPSLETTKKHLTPITLLLDWTPNPNHIPLYVGVTKGFFQEQNIELKIQKNTDTGSVIPHILFEKVDLAPYHALGTIKLAMQGTPIQIVASLINSTLQGFIYRLDDNISTIQDLNNKVLGFCLNNSRDLSCLLNILRQQGVVPSEVKNVSSDLISPMLLKKIDFLYGAFYNIEGVKLRTLGIPVGCFLSDSYGLPTGPQILICGKKNTQATSPKIVHAIQTALQKSIDFCQEHPQEAFDIYTTATKDTPKIINDELLQWEVTRPLLARSQHPLSQQLANTLVQAVVYRYPQLSEKSSEFSLYTLYPNLQVYQDVKTHEQVAIEHHEELPLVFDQH
ncbi:hypothetical protein BOKEGFJH_00509 [Chlamydia avium]|uniref:Binding--dependent transport system inner membrane component family protein n=1 Tax=Chlamydia avium TaxID=1457141 RepID=A0ABN0MRM5_9CHLA|nr:ABC transporter substrate-binding protein [Chlamydia avium]EPP38087.1 binding--dependent transport system inner membrane component family protein [Chlamydia avium]VVT42982.1 hypothetical protein BOKEGFJH_00509 [Chlamydia avium]